jgi:limonene-1,2-epoxide hydrolase
MAKVWAERATSESKLHRKSKGVHRGIDAIGAEFQSIVTMVPSTSVDIESLAASRGTVMTERVDNFEIDGKPIRMEVIDISDLDTDSRITRWRT